ncbi:unnamed protein product [Effrenium voratum]|nr:unnamed protein product [Effrenium voratum]
MGASRGLWEWQDATWHRLNSKDASILEAAYLQDPEGACPLSLGPHECCYEVDFSVMQQRNRASGKIRNLRRKARPTAERQEELEGQLKEAVEKAESVAKEAASAQAFLPPLPQERSEQSLQREPLVEAEFGSLAALQRSISSGAVVLLRGSWLARRELKDLREAPPEACWRGPLDLDTPKLVAVSGLQEDQPERFELLKRLVDLQLQQLDDFALFLDTTCAPEASEWAKLGAMVEWFASPFTTTWSLTRSFAPWTWLQRCLAQLASNSREKLLEVSDLDERLDWAHSLPLVPPAFDVILSEMHFQRPKDFEIIKGLYKEAFERVLGAREWMDFSGFGLDDFHAVQLAEVLLHSQSLVKLVLAENQISDLGMQALAPQLPASLKLLDLSQNSVGDLGVSALAKHLPPRLQQLCLSSNTFGAEGLETLLRRLPSCLDLTSLRLARLPLGRAGLSLDLGQLRSVARLSLAEVQLGQWVAALHLPPQLEELQLDENCLGDPGLIALAPKLATCNTLRSLSLNENAFADAGLRALARALPPCLRSLRVNMNYITPQALQELRSFLPELEVYAFNQRV